MTINNKKSMTKTTIFAALILTLIVPISGMNNADATIPNTQNPNIGKVADGTYNEELAFQRALELKDMHDEKRKNIDKLEQKLAKSNIAATNAKQIRDQVSNIKADIDALMQEFDVLQQENQKLYYMEPETYQRYADAKTNFWNTITENNWKGKSFEVRKDSFPLVSAGINHKEKAVEIMLHNDIEDLPGKQRYIAMIERNMPDDVEWFVSYGEYPESTSHCTSNPRCDEYRPAIGGIGIKGNADGSCTLGFRVVLASNWNVQGFATAGHCLDKTRASGTFYVHQPGNGNVLGYAANSMYTVGGTTECDCGWVWVPNSNDMTDGIYNTPPKLPYAPSTFTNAANQTAGSWVTMSGVTSGITSGGIINTDVTITYADGTTVNNLLRAQYSSAGGDSGAPITSLFGTSFYGIAVARNYAFSYYSPIDQVMNGLGVWPTLG